MGHDDRQVAVVHCDGTGGTLYSTLLGQVVLSGLVDGEAAGLVYLEEGAVIQLEGEGVVQHILPLLIHERLLQEVSAIGE